MNDGDAFEEWCKKYKPIGNHLDENASFGGWYETALDGDERGIMFETFGVEETFVRETAIADPNRVWTYVDSEDGTCVINGMHWVNRIGYFITELPADDDVITVVVSSNNPDNTEPF
jgi:hypothetical protein